MFADNDRISTRQLYCQIVLAMVGVMLLFLPGYGPVYGWKGVLSCVIGFLAIGVYAFYLVRIAPICRRPERWIGRLGSRVTGAIFASFFVITGAFFLRLISNMIETYLLTGVSMYVIHGVLLAACLSAGMPVVQKRGRMADASFWVLFGILILLLVLAAFQQDWTYLDQEIGLELNKGVLLKGGYYIFAAFTGMGALPFLLSQVKGKQCGAVVGACGTLLAVLAVVLLLLQGSFGDAQVQTRPWPVIALIAGIRMPGQFLLRFDPLWIALFLFLMLFAIGSTLFYSNLILERTKIPLPWYWVALAIYMLSVLEYEGQGIDTCYSLMLLYGYTPLILLINLILGWCGRRKRL